MGFFALIFSPFFSLVLKEEKSSYRQELQSTFYKVLRHKWEIFIVSFTAALIGTLPKLTLPKLLTNWPGGWVFRDVSSFLIGGVLGSGVVYLILVFNKH